MDFVYVPRGWCIHTHPQNRAKGTKNPSVPSGPDPVSESDDDQGLRPPSPWP